MGHGRKPKTTSSSCTMWIAKPVSECTGRSRAFAYKLIVEIFAEWLYTGNYPEDSQFCSCSSHGFCCCRQLARVKACEFGHRFQANDFMLESEDALVDSIIANTPWYETIIYAFDHLRPTSPVLQAIIDKHCHTWDEKIDEIGNELDLRSKLPYDFWMGVSLRYMQIRGGREEALDRCDYHRHESDKERGRNCEVPRIDNFSDDDDDANTTV